MTSEPSSNIGMLMGGVVVDDGVDRLSDGNLFLDDIEETNELLMAMALHVAADHRAVEDVHRGEQRRCAVPLIVVRHGSTARPFFSGSPGCVRSSAWIWLFSSTDRTMACAGGST